MRANINWSSDDWDSDALEMMDDRTLIKVDGDYWVYKIEATGKVALIFSSGSFTADVYDNIYSSMNGLDYTSWGFSAIKLKRFVPEYQDAAGNSHRAPQRAHKEGVLRKATLSQVIGWLEGEVEGEVTRKSVLFKVQ
jgi:hypothetical protein